jgi:hemoglobin
MVSRRCALWIAAAVFAPLAIALTIPAVTLADSKTTGVVAKTADANSLYKRLGGYDAIAAVTDDFIARLVSDKRLGRFFVGLNDEHKAHVRQMAVDLICAKTGGPCYYLGRDMKTAHTGLGITEDDWTRASAAMKVTLDKFNVGAKEQAELFAIIGPLKPDIVGR